MRLVEPAAWPASADSTTTSAAPRPGRPSNPPKTQGSWSEMGRWPDLACRSHPADKKPGHDQTLTSNEKHQSLNLFNKK
jgi:hypothetical protein